MFKFVFLLVFVWCSLLAMSLVWGQVDAKEQKDVIEQLLARRAPSKISRAMEPLPLTDWNILGEEEAKQAAARIQAYQDFIKSHPHTDDTSTHSADETLLPRLISKATPDLIVTALACRRELRAKASPELRKLVSQGGILGGIAAMILGGHHPETVLDGGDREAQRALLACARWLHEPLPHTRVTWLSTDSYPDSDPKLLQAVELYLESEGDATDRQMILGHHLGEMKIVGTTYCWYARLLYLCEKELRQEMLRPGAPDEIYAFFEIIGGGGWLYIIRVGGIRAQLMSHRTYAFQFFPADKNFLETKYRYCYVAPAELQELRQFLSKYQVDDLPEFDTGVCDGIQYEYLHLTKAGGRRVFMNNPDTLSGAGTVYDLLPRYFLQFIEKHQMQAHDKGSKYPPGIELLLAQEAGYVQTVWKQGDDTRVLIEKGNREAWYSFHDGRLGEPVAAPKTQARHKQSLIFRTGFGYYLVTPDGTWSVEEKVQYGQDALDTFSRRDLATGKEYNLALPPTAHDATMIAFIPAHRKVLISWHDLKDRYLLLERYFLLDPATGSMEPMQGDMEPWRQQSYRPLQAATLTYRVWVARYDLQNPSTQIGLYDTKTFVFTPTIVIPFLYFTSMKMWVDEAEGKIYVAHQGDLLRLPLKNLKISIDGPGRVCRYNALEYQISVTNDGDCAAQAIAICCSVPPSLRYLYSKPPGTFKPGNVDKPAIVTWSARELAAKSKKEITIVLRPTTIERRTNIVQLVAQADSSLCSMPSYTMLNIEIFGKPRLDVHTDCSPDPVKVGQKIVYSTTIWNDGTDETVFASAQMSIPPNLEFVKAEVAGSAEYDEKEAQVTIHFHESSLKPGGKKTHNIICRAVKPGKAELVWRIKCCDFSYRNMHEYIETEIIP